MASCANPVIQSYLRNTYGTKKLCWAIVWLKDNDIAFYTFELNKYCDTNSLTGKRPTGTTKNTYFVSYVDDPRFTSPQEPLLLPSLDKDYNCSYEYITKSGQTDYVTVDLDYVWKRNGGWHALELTTWYVPFSDQEEAERLISTMNRRPSWNSPHGAAALLKQIEAVEDLRVAKYIMGCVNTKKGVSNDIKVNGNAYWFELTPNQVARLGKGTHPDNGHFGTFHEFLQSL
jgi:hypothetical protein